jgi:hypothetical protein
MANVSQNPIDGKKKNNPEQTAPDPALIIHRIACRSARDRR